MRRTNNLSFSHIITPAKFDTPVKCTTESTGRAGGSRSALKNRLMSANATCSACGLQLRPDAGFSNSAFLIRDSLSCQEHVKEVRKEAKQRKAERVVVNLTELGRKWFDRQRTKVDRLKEHEQRQNLKASLMEADPHCVHCGCKLGDGDSGHRAACLVIDRLSCLVHVRIVRDYAFADSERAIIEESVSPADQAEMDAQAFWAEVASTREAVHQ